MRRVIDAAWLCAALASALTGYAVSPGGAAVAQEASPRPGPSFQSTIPAAPLNQPVPLWPNQPRETTYWSIDDIRKAHRILSAAETSGRATDPNTTLHDFPYWTRTHSLFVAYVPARREAGRAAAQHVGYSQFIVIIGGSGTVTAGGELKDKTMLIDAGRAFPGEYRGTGVMGGEAFRVAEGDWLSIPPDTPAQFQADAGGMTCMVMKVNAMLYPWELIR
jgi:mannose-6-phosphate isomerase-like protein (cupin superfamily)